jgi:hypothetical protein
MKKNNSGRSHPSIGRQVPTWPSHFGIKDQLGTDCSTILWFIYSFMNNELPGPPFYLHEGVIHHVPYSTELYEHNRNAMTRVVKERDYSYAFMAIGLYQDGDYFYRDARGFLEWLYSSVPEYDREAYSHVPKFGYDPSINDEETNKLIVWYLDQFMNNLLPTFPVTSLKRDPLSPSVHMATFNCIANRDLCPTFLSYGTIKNYLRSLKEHSHIVVQSQKDNGYRNQNKAG